MKHTRVHRKKHMKRTRKHRGGNGVAVCGAQCPYGNGVHAYGNWVLIGTLHNKYDTYAHSCMQCGCVETMQLIRPTSGTY